MKKLLFLLLLPILSFGQIPEGYLESSNIIIDGKIYYPTASLSILATGENVKTHNLISGDIGYPNQTISHASYIEHPLPAKKPYPQVLGYVSYVPSDRKLPLLVALGGYGQNPGNGRSDLYKLMSDGIGDMLRDNNWKQDSFIVVLPQSGSKEYNPKSLHNFIEYIKVNYNVDTSRIYITGLSGGANSLYKYLALYQCAAAITISGAGNYKKVCENETTKTPLWAFHGENDGVVKPGPDKLLIPKYNVCIPVDHEHAELTIYPGAGHNVWDRTYANDMIYRWLLFHRSKN